MSDLENPYASPETQIVPEEKQSSGVELTVNMLQSLNEASPWLRFIGILGYIGAGFCAFAGVIGTIGTIIAGSFFDEFSGSLGFIFLIYVPVAAIVFFPAHYTFKFGQKIRSYKFTNSIEDLEQALKNNKSLWKFSGILCIIYLAIIPVFFIGAIVVGIISALSF